MNRKIVRVLAALLALVTTAVAGQWYSWYGTYQPAQYAEENYFEVGALAYAGDMIFGEYQSESYASADGCFGPLGETAQGISLYGVNPEVAILTLAQATTPGFNTVQASYGWSWYYDSSMGLNVPYSDYSVGGYHACSYGDVQAWGYNFGW